MSDNIDFRAFVAWPFLRDYFTGFFLFKKIWNFMWPRTRNVFVPITPGSAHDTMELATNYPSMKTRRQIAHLNLIKLFKEMHSVVLIR